MTEDKDKILSDINNSGGEIEKEEHQLYKEFLEYHSKHKTETALTDKKIIDFIPLRNEEINYESDLHKYAADSGAGSAFSGMKQSDFYISADDRYALKCISISDDELCVNILTEVNSNEEMLLYLPELNKYYLPNSNGEYIISGASAKSLSKINFKVYLHKEKVKIYESGKSYSLISVNNMCRPEVIDTKDSFLIIKLNAAEYFFKAV